MIYAMFVNEKIGCVMCGHTRCGQIPFAGGLYAPGGGAICKIADK